MLKSASKIVLGKPLTDFQRCTFKFESFQTGFERWSYKSPLVDSPIDMSSAGCVLDVIKPTGWTPNGTYKVIYLLPALDQATEDVAPIAVSAGIADTNNCVVVVPYFRNAYVWYGRHPDGTADHHKFTTLLPQFSVKYLGAAQGRNAHRLMGYSKSATGALQLLLRNPSVFGYAYCWDGPWDVSTANWSYPSAPFPDWNQDESFVTKAQMLLYDPVTLLPLLGAKAAGDKLRIGIAGFSRFAGDLTPIFNALTGAGLVQNTNWEWVGASSEVHSYSAGWLPAAATRLISY